MGLIPVKIKSSHQLDDADELEEVEMYDSEANLNIDVIKKGRKFPPKRKSFRLLHD
jgi:hypothetical protein